MDDRPRERSDSHRLRTSWEENAAAWTTAVRGGHIASRREGTDEAILRACRRTAPRRILDVGCGEGWLTRALAAFAEEAVGIDASAPLIEVARAAGGAGMHFEVIDYEQLTRDANVVPGPWDVVVCNFALLDEHVAPLLAALGSRLAAGGRILIQTVHPANVPDSTSGWREESFDAFGVSFPAAMPWYFRTLDAWRAEITAAGLTLAAVEEPRHPETARPLSLLMECVALG